MSFVSSMLDLFMASEQKWAERHNRHAEHLTQLFIRLEKRIMETVQVQQAQLDELNASITKQQGAVGKLKEDSNLMLGLILDLRTSLAHALENGTPPTIVDLSAAIDSIDSVTKELSDETTTEEAVLNPTPVVPGTPVENNPAAPATTGMVQVSDLNPKPGNNLGNVQDHPGNAAPQEPDDATAPHPSPNAGDPTALAVTDSTAPVVVGTNSADLKTASTGTNDTSQPNEVALAKGRDGSGAPRTQNAS